MGANAFILNSAAGSDVMDWAKRVQKNGGGTPSYNTIQALQHFYEEIGNYGLTPLMKSMCVFVPDSFTASVTPLIKVSGFDPWVPKNFAATALSVNGITGTGTAYLETGVSGSVFTTQSFGITLVSNLRVVEDKQDVGVDIPGDAAFRLTTRLFNSEFFDYGSVGDGDRLIYNHGNNIYAGYFSGNGTARNAVSLFFASGSSVHQQVTSSVRNHSNPNSMAAAQTFVFGVNRLASGVADISTRRYSFVGFHLGMTFTQSLYLSNAIRTMRTRLGGGNQF